MRPEPADQQPRTTFQPYLFDLISCVDAPSVVLSAADGQIEEGGVQGWLYGDRRFLSRLRFTVGGCVPVGLGAEPDGAARTVFRAVVPQFGDPVNDPTIFVTRQREVRHDELVETFTVTSTARQPTRVSVAVEIAADFSEMAQVRSARPRGRVRPEADGASLAWRYEGDAMRVRATPDPDTADAADGRLTWRLDLPPGDTVALQLHAAAARADDVRQTEHADHPCGRQFTGADRVPWSRPDVTCADPAVAPAVLRGLDDLEGLLLEDAVGGRGDLFVAAGTPWFLTLFGRDSLWTARMMMPLGTDLATSTLRALARRQGARDDPDTGEMPGRILHEVRAETLALDTVTLPPTYYGTADATQLFVICCAEAWRWGADPAEIADLLPAVERALGWMERQAGEGFIRYVDTTGEGLANHGWKDSKEGVQWADGSLVKPPVALTEVQGYAYQAAVLGADLLDGFDRPGADRWRAWARTLAERFRAAFWVQDAHGRYPAIALDRDGAAADSVTSNMGHLLGTGLLDAEESALVAARLSSPDLDSGFGLRTLTAAAPRFSPLSYHGGSVWPHDTAIAAAGLGRAGFGEEAAALVEGLFRAAPHFDFRLPELYGGDRGGPVHGPMPYPAACRPQAWSAAAPVSALVALLGLDVDVPAGTLSARSALPDSLRPLTLTGLRLGRHALDVSVDAAGRVSLETDRPGLRIG